MSKADGSQLLGLQRDALIDVGVAEERIYEDRASGRKDHRPGLESCQKALQPGNTFVVWKLDRLARDLQHLVSTVKALRERGVGLRVLAGAGAEIDTGTANGRLIFAIFAALAEFERELIAERTRAGLTAARARAGRPTAAPLTAGTPLSMEKGARMETAAGWQRNRWKPAPTAAEGKIERLDEGSADAARDRLVIARVGPARGIQPGGAVEAREVDGVAGMCGELLQVLELRAAVALAERVNMVEVAQHGPAPSAKPSGPDPRK